MRRCVDAIVVACSPVYERLPRSSSRILAMSTQIITLSDVARADFEMVPASQPDPSESPPARESSAA